MRDGLMMDDVALSLTALVTRAERFTPEAPVVARLGDGSLRRTTIGACAGRARRLAGALEGLGVGAGDRVATLLWNGTEHLELYFAVPLMGAVLHTLNPRLSAADLSFIARDAEDRVLVVDASLVHLVAEIDWRFDHLIVVGGEADTYEPLIAAGAPMAWPDLDERRAAVMCYTSGTTGRPKGVVYSHRALVLHSMSHALPNAFCIGAGDTLLPAVPMFHVNAWGLPYTAALTGAGLVLPGPRLDAVSLLELLAGERVTLAAGVPTVFMGVLDALDAQPDRWDLSRLSRITLGGAAVATSLLAGFDRHGLTMIQGWGMTETSPLGTVGQRPVELNDVPAGERLERRTRAGIPIPLIEIRGRARDGSLIAWDDAAVGELEIRGPWVAAGYHRGVGAERFTDDGWFATGDIVSIDPRGSVRIRDRAKDMIKSGGEWISSVELENRLMVHACVAEAAVVAVPDDRWGERPLAAVVLRDGMSADADELRDHLAASFARWQLPDRIEFVEAIPRGATGKFHKAALRERFAVAPVLR